MTTLTLIITTDNPDVLDEVVDGIGEVIHESEGLHQTRVTGLRDHEVVLQAKYSRG